MKKKIKKSKTQNLPQDADDRKIYECWLQCKKDDWLHIVEDRLIGDYSIEQAIAHFAQHDFYKNKIFRIDLNSITIYVKNKH